MGLFCLPRGVEAVIGVNSSCYSYCKPYALRMGCEGRGVHNSGNLNGSYLAMKEMLQSNASSIFCWELLMHVVHGKSICLS